MLRFASLAAATCVLAACPAPRAPAVHDDAALRIAIARAEVARSIDDLRRRATTGERDERVLALRALGRIGGADVTQLLVAALRDPDPHVVAAAAGALGTAAQLDEPEPSAEITSALVSAATRVPPELRAIVLEAIGRAGDVSGQRTLITSLRDPSPAVVEAAALGLARYGRRKLALVPDARTALIPLLSGPPAARYAATYAFAREHEPPPDADPASPLTIALLARLADDDPQVRAQAVAALGKRGLLTLRDGQGRADGGRADDVGARRARVIAMLDDVDWRVAVEAVRVVGADDDGRDAIAAMLPHRYAAIAKDPREAQVVIEAARTLAPHASRSAVRAALDELAKQPPAHAHHDVAFAWIDCLARAGLARASSPPEYGFVDACSLPDHLKLPLLVEAVAAKVGVIAQRRAAVSRLLAHSDPRVRAAGIGALAELWDESTDAERHETIASLVDNIRAPDAMVAGAAIEAAGAIYDKLAESAGSTAPRLDATTLSHPDAAGATRSQARVELDAAIVARAGTERDAELGASILELIGKQKIAAGLDACRAALGGEPVRAKAARACVIALGDAPPPAPAHTPLVAPPYDVADVIGHHLVWHLVTTRGTIDIALRPEVAPWAVATIVGLTRKGFYNGLEVHRVVGNFVVQGGDPTSSGWGGPGFALPAEPSTLADGVGFVVGGVGMADAGRDSAGSQWFVMHGSAPHLDGRYTWFGVVEDGQRVADALVIGDKVITATVMAARPELE